MFQVPPVGRHSQRPVMVQPIGPRDTERPRSSPFGRSSPELAGSGTVRLVPVHARRPGRIPHTPRRPTGPERGNPVFLPRRIDEDHIQRDLVKRVVVLLGRLERHFRHHVGGSGLDGGRGTGRRYQDPGSESTQKRKTKALVCTWNCCVFQPCLPSTDSVALLHDFDDAI